MTKHLPAPPLSNRDSAPEEAPAPSPDRAGCTERNSLLASAWHHVTEASERIERLQARLAALGIVAAQTSLT